MAGLSYMHMQSAYKKEEETHAHVHKVCAITAMVSFLDQRQVISFLGI